MSESTTVAADLAANGSLAYADVDSAYFDSFYLQYIDNTAAQYNLLTG